MLGNVAQYHERKVSMGFWGDFFETSKYFLLNEKGVFYRINKEDDFSLVVAWIAVDSYELENDGFISINSKGTWFWFNQLVTLTRHEEEEIPPAQFHPPQLHATPFQQAKDKIDTMKIYDAKVFAELEMRITEAQVFYDKITSVKERLLPEGNLIGCRFNSGLISIYAYNLNVVYWQAWRDINIHSPALKYAKRLQDEMPEITFLNKDQKKQTLQDCKDVVLNIHKEQQKNNPNTETSATLYSDLTNNDDVTPEELEAFLHETYLPLVAKEPGRKREFIICSDKLGEQVRSDDFFVFRAQDLKTQSDSAFHFQVGHPQDGCVYIAHPLKPNIYYELNEFHSHLLEEKQDELVHLIESLGASRIRVEVVHTTDVSRESSSQISLQADGGHKVVSASGGGSLATEKGEQRSTYQRFCDDIVLNPRGNPFIPDNLLFYPHETKWQRIAKQALQGRYKEFSIELEYKTDYAINTKRVCALNAKVQTLLSNVNVEFSSESSRKLQKAMSTVLRYSAIFEARSEEDMEEVEDVKPLPLPPQKSKSELTEAEQDYVEALKDALADGAMTPPVRNILERMRSRLGISSERANELEHALVAPALSEEELEYQEDVKACLAEGEIKGFARRMLDKRRTELGLTPEQAKAVESLTVTKIGGKETNQMMKNDDKDSADAQFKLGIRYANGDGVEENVEKAAACFRTAAEQGHVGAQANLGVCYAAGEGVEEDAAEAVKWYRKAAEQGHADAQFDLGMCYAEGEGVEEDAAEAVAWFRKAAEQGHADAQSNLGVCYINGEGVEEDAAEAFKWFRKAAEQGHETAQLNLGMCYYSGNGVGKDLAEAIKWFAKAAEQGNAIAQCNMGECYANGDGVETDMAEAVKWLTKAAEQGHEQAIEMLEEIQE